MLVSLQSFCGASGIIGVPSEKLEALLRSVTDDIDVVQPLSGDLLQSHKEDEADLFFEVAVGDQGVQALKKIARSRILSKWSEQELSLCKAIA